MPVERGSLNPGTAERRPRITIVGSFMTDLMSRSPHLPVPGETVMGGPFQMGPGGKGANQAVAAARLGSDVNILVSLGKDQFGDFAYNNLLREGIGVEFVKRVEGMSTGAALIIVDDAKGENMIVVAPGSNSALGADDVDKGIQVILDSDYVLMQLEIPLETVEYTAKLAHASGVKVILNPAPGRPLSDELLRAVDVLTPNETEASIVSGITVTDLATAELAGKALVRRGCPTVIVTMGGLGVLVVDANGAQHVPGFKVDVVDTTGAGDAFNGALAAALAEGLGMRDAARWACAAAAISVTRIGTSVATAHRDEVEAFLAGRP
ncbi:MAG: ribokinase [Clostridia bacterium]|nr:ribokinase [Clostridia bacterium]